MHDSDSSSLISNLDTHLQFLIPMNPGTISRRGYPWSLGNGSPFCSQAKITLFFGSNALSMGMETANYSP